MNVVVAVSGGADSVALLRLLHEAKQTAGGTGELFAAHFNHRLRGAQADADALWVADLCRELGVRCELGSASESAPLADNEQTAREARYEFLLATAERLGARFIATAHTADDQVETLLMRVLRGTGVAGLAGIPPRRPLSPSVTVVRPLLEITREDVLQELERWGQPYREDPTNLTPRYTRNRVRLKLLPLLREEFGVGVDKALLGLLQQAAETQEVIEAAARQLLEGGVVTNPEGHIEIDRRLVSTAAPLVLAEAIKLAWRGVGWPEQSMGRQQWRQLDAFIRSEAPRDAFDLPGGVHAHRQGDLVVLARVS